MADPPHESRTATGASEECAWLGYYEQTLARARYGEPGRLLRHGAKIYSQNDEDGILQEIFRQIGVEDRRFIEFGVQTGIECNSVFLLMSGWQGLWLEVDGKAVASIQGMFEPLLTDGRLRCINAKVTVDTIDDLLAEEGDVDLLSIDTDFNDYWLWKALTVIRPRVVVIEYNATLKPPISVTVPHDPADCWDGSSYFGASLTALEKLGCEKGYALVGCCFSGVNAFFVREDLLGEHFCAPFTAQNHYEPPRYWMRYPVGHPPQLGIFEEV